MARKNASETPEDPQVRAERLARNRYLPPGQKLAKDGKPFTSTGPLYEDEPVVDWTNWRQRMRTSHVKLDDRQKVTFLNAYAESGMLFNSAYKAGVSCQCVRNHVKNDPEFEAAFAEAKERYRDKIERTAFEVAHEGLYEPVVGGKNKDEIIGYKRVIATNILAMQMKRSNPEYRDQQSIDMTVKGGVLVTPGNLSPSEWATQFGAPDKLDSDQE